MRKKLGVFYKHLRYDVSYPANMKNNLINKKEIKYSKKQYYKRSKNPINEKQSHLIIKNCKP